MTPAPLLEHPKNKKKGAATPPTNGGCRAKHMKNLAQLVNEWEQGLTDEEEEEEDLTEEDRLDLEGCIFSETDEINELAGEYASPEEQASFSENSSLGSLTHRIMDSLTPKERKVLETRFSPKKGKEAEKIKEIEQRALRKLRHRGIKSI